MLILSIILMLAGAASAVFGIMQNNDMELQMESIFSDGTANPGTVWIVIGAVALVVGVVLLVIHFTKKGKA